jgi:hypothetical protein
MALAHAGVELRSTHLRSLLPELVILRGKIVLNGLSDSIFRDHVHASGEIADDIDAK